MVRLTRAALAVLFATSPAFAADAKDLLIADFELETYGDWKTTGEAFGPGPAAGALPGQMNVDGFEGNRLVNSFFKGDGTVGTLTSPPLKIERKFLNFLIGGGAHPQTRIELVVDGKVVRQASGPNDQAGGSERLEWHSWTVEEFSGKTATVRIVDEHRGGWGHINVDQIVQSDAKTMAEPARWEIAVEKTYLWLPVQNGAPKQRMSFSVEGQKVREFEIELARDKTDFHVFADVSGFKGKTLVVESARRGDAPLPSIEQSDDLPAAGELYREALRPQFHFTSRRGWLNDPNGLVWHNGEYHLYYQHNPYGHEWGNMHWGHAVSKDLLHWRELPIGIYPQKFGDMAFSGSAVLDARNDSGFGTKEKPPLVAAYTSTGRGECVVYSNDDGRTWTEFEGNPVVKHEGRDPRLLYHEGSKQWVMALYDEFEGKRWITFHTSLDLKTWKFASRIEGFFECPDIIQLPVDGKQADSRWVLYGADAKYVVGDFDGREFLPEEAPSSRRQIWYGNYYAAQTYTNAPNGRCIQIGWAQGIGFPGMPFNQQMAIPVELTLKRTPEGVRLRANPVQELTSLGRVLTDKSDVKVTGNEPLTFSAAATEMRVHVRGLTAPADGEVSLKVGGEVVTYKPHPGEIRFRDITAPAPAVNGAINLDIVLDRRSIEIFVNDGQSAISRERVTEPKAKDVSISVSGGEAAIEKVTVESLRSALPGASRPGFIETF
jgi:fructan beta-fructosidase